MRKAESFWSRISAVCIVLAIVCAGALGTSGQSKKTWQPGTVIQVKAHEASSSKQYDVTVQVGKKIYVATHTMKDGEPDLEYYVGMARMVLIDGQTLTFNDLLGHPHSLQIVSSKDAPETPAQ